MQQANIQI